MISASYNVLTAINGLYVVDWKHFLFGSVATALLVEVASFPGLYHSFCRLQYKNRGEGLEGFRT